MSGCTNCGSTRAVLRAGRCLNLVGCERRRVARRVEEDRKTNPNKRQCMGSRGSTSIEFCIMRQGHKGHLHSNGSSEWGDEDETEAGRLFAGVLRPE